MNKKAFAISALTVFVQYYDYHLFGFLAANIAIHFFPKADIIVQLLNTYFLMSIAMIAKPLGAIIFGRIGDLTGRSNSFIISLVGTSVASLILFVTPSNDTIGLFSVFILLLCRMVISAFVSSGSDGVRIFVFEHLKSSMQCFSISITTVFTLLGTLTASLSATAFGSSYFLNYNWKFAFLLGSVLGLAVIILMKITNFKDQVEISKQPKFKKFKDLSIYEIVKTNKKLFALCVLLIGAIGSTNQFILIFFGTYNFQILETVEKSKMQEYISISIVIYMIFSIIGGIIADKFGKYKITIIAAFALLPISFGQCYYLDKLELSPILLFLTSATLPFLTMPGAVILTKSIPISIRYRLFSLSHAIGSIVISAPTAFISTFLYHQTNISWLPVCYFIVTILVISFALYKLNKSTSLSDEHKDTI
ncbi:MAG: MFS transporter [Rickettsiaceae bacterium]